LSLNVFLFLESIKVDKFYVNVCIVDVNNLKLVSLTLAVMSKSLIKILSILCISSLWLGMTAHAQVSKECLTVLHHNHFDTLDVKIGKNKNSFFVKTFNAFCVRRKSKPAFVEDKEANFLDYEDKRIRYVRVMILKPFGPRITDTTLIAEGWLYKTANVLHNSTKNAYVERLISFKSGDEVSAWELADNERFLRKMSIFHDVDISVQEVDDNYVDVLVLCEDVFSMAIEMSSDFKDEVNVSIFHKNLFGYGHQLIWDVNYDKSKEDIWDYSLKYSIKNISRSYIDLNMGVKETRNGNGFDFSLQRDFELSSTKWGGLLRVKGINNANVLPYEKKNDYKTYFDYMFFDSWLGYSHNTFNNYKRINNFMLAVGYKSIAVKDAPTDINIFPYYMSRHRYLSSFSYSKREYYKTNYIHDLGKTEDIVEGCLLNLTLGFETNDESNLFYSGFQLAKSWFFKRNMGYTAMRLSFGTFYNKNKIERGVVEFKSQSISKLFKLNRSLCRFNTSISYMIGFNRYPEDFVFFNEYIRGLNSKEIQGNQKLSFNLTQNIFLPYIVNGFRCSVFAFADIGWIGDNDKPIYEASDYYGIGLGLKFNNDNLIFRTFSIRFAFYPNVPNDYRQFSAIVHASGEGDYINLKPQRPEIIEYK
jgi:hypothetical protein